MVMFTLDPAGGRRVWRIDLKRPSLTSIAASVEETVEQLIRIGTSAVERLMPSIQIAQVYIQVDQSNDPSEVVGNGGVRFLQSEWDALKRSADGETHFGARP